MKYFPGASRKTDNIKKTNRIELLKHHFQIFEVIWQKYSKLISFGQQHCTDYHHPLTIQNQGLPLPQMVDMKQQQQRRQHSLREVGFLKKKVGTDPRHSDLIQELNVLEAAMAEELFKIYSLGY